MKKLQVNGNFVLPSKQAYFAIPFLIAFNALERVESF